MGADSNRLAVFAWIVMAGLLLVRVPSLAEPAGADQALYTYVGQRILAGEVPYRDAWDQKPPGVHLAYAGLIALWPHQSVVAGADLLAAGLTALALVALGRRLAPASGAGELAAILFLLLGNPAFGRLGGVRVRAQCEVFIGLAVAAALLAAWRATRRDPFDRLWLAVAGALVGVAVLFKYNALVYALPVMTLVLTSTMETAGTFAWSRVVKAGGWMAAGGLLSVAVMLAWLAGAGALDDLYRATVTYNVQYSGETYGGRLAMLQYLVTFPVRYARVDPLWFVGGLGTIALGMIAAIRRRRERVAPAAIAACWVASACLAIAINGSRGLPQYFVQAGPALALAAGLAGTWGWGRTGWLARAIVVLLLAVAVARIASFPKLVDNTVFDWHGLSGTIGRETYLARFGNADSGDKYSALAVAELAAFIREHSVRTDRIYVFGFSPWAYVGSDRASASRFFWSRPVIIGFEDGHPGYGVTGLLESLTKARPRLVVLQERDWDPDVTNSADFFLADPRLSAWLRDNYAETRRLHNFRIWILRTS